MPICRCDAGHVSSTEGLMKATSAVTGPGGDLSSRQEVR